MKEYSTSFKTVGSSYDETLLLLKEFNRNKSWEKVEATAYGENLLKKKSRSWIAALLRDVRRRYLDPHPPLPPGKAIARFVDTPVPRLAKIQVLYQYICENDPLIDRLVLSLVAPGVQEYGIFLLSKPTYFEFFEQEAKVHRELQEWADYTKERWQRDYYAFLRYSGIMNPAPSVEVHKFVLRDEAFGFLVYGLLNSGLSPAELVSGPVFTRFFFNKAEIESRLLECQVQGWLQFQGTGGIYELSLTHTTLEEWIDALEPRAHKTP
jgi:hypothetical protein